MREGRRRWGTWSEPLPYAEQVAAASPGKSHVPLGAPARTPVHPSQCPTFDSLWCNWQHRIIQQLSLPICQASTPDTCHHLSMCPPHLPRGGGVFPAPAWTWSQPTLTAAGTWLRHSMFSAHLPHCWASATLVPRKGWPVHSQLQDQVMRVKRVKQAVVAFGWRPYEEGACVILDVGLSGKKVVVSLT